MADEKKEDVKKEDVKKEDVKKEKAPAVKKCRVQLLDHRSEVVEIAPDQGDLEAIEAYKQLVGIVATDKPFSVEDLK